jgi:hypothetical protein
VAVWNAVRPDQSTFWKIPTEEQLVSAQEADLREQALLKGRLKLAINSTDMAASPEEKANCKRIEDDARKKYDDATSRVERLDFSIGGAAERRARAERKARIAAARAQDDAVWQARTDFLSDTIALTNEAPVFVRLAFAFEASRVRLSNLVYANPRITPHWLNNLTSLLPQEIARVSPILPGDNLRTAQSPPGFPRLQNADMLPPLLETVKGGLAFLEEELARAEATRAAEDADAE